MCCKDLLAAGFRNAVGKRELEFLGEKLLNVWALDIVGLLDFHNLEDLYHLLVHITIKTELHKRT